MKKALKINLFIFVLLLSCFAGSILAKGNALQQPDAKYILKEMHDEKELGYGVSYHRDIGSLMTTNPDAINGNDAGLGSSTLAKINVEYGEQVNIVEIEAGAKARLVPYAVLKGSNWYATTVRSAAKEYEETHPGKKVIAGINGDGFAINYDCKTSTSSTISDGEVYKIPALHNIAIRNDAKGKRLKSLEAPLFNNYAPYLTVYLDCGSKKFPVDVVNREEELEDGQIGLYYAERIDRGTKCTPVLTPKNVWLVEKAEQAVSTVKDGFYGKGIITDFKEERVNINRFGMFSVASKNKELNELLKKGVSIRCQYEYNDPELAGLTNVIGYYYKLLENNIASDTNDKIRHPRTMIGQREDGSVVLAVVDGRQGDKNMYGATAKEMQALMSCYGCVDAWNFDGGGSSTMIVRKLQGWDFKNGFKDKENKNSDWWVTNSPSDGDERSDGNFLFVVADVPLCKMQFTDVFTDAVKLKIDLTDKSIPLDSLYASFDGREMIPVDAGGCISFNNLLPDKTYKFVLYIKDKDKYNSIYDNLSFTTAFIKPAVFTNQITIGERGGKPVLKMHYNIDRTAGITRIDAKINGMTYHTKGFTQYIPLNIPNLNSLANAEYKIVFKKSSLIDSTEEIIFSSNNNLYGISFVSQEINYRYHSSFLKIID